MIDISDEEDSSRKCYKYPHKLRGSLNIAYNDTNSMICLWNKYQIFIHERLNFEDAAKIIIPEFQIKQSLLVDNYLLCLDFGENIHLISLKFKHSAAKRLKSNFSPKDQNILVITHIGDDLMSLKFENGIYYICTYRVKPDFQPATKQKININSISTYKEKCILVCQPLTSQEFDTMGNIFNCKDCIWKNHCMLIISFDKKILYGCFVNSHSNKELNLVKLFSCPTEISDIKVTNKNHLVEIIIGLLSGSLIKLSLNTEKSSSIVHTNTCINKFVEINDSIIYTNGFSMWKTDKTFDNFTISQLFVKQPKDFIKCSDQMICTTYTNFIYIFSIDDETVFLNPPTDKYCSPEHLLNNTQYMQQIIDEVAKINGLLKQIDEEKKYITTLALSNKQDLMDTIVQYTISVYDNYEEVLNEYRILTFLDDPKYIFDRESYLILVEIKTTHLQHNFKEILSHLFGDLRVHITFLTDKNVIKTSSIKILDELKKTNIVVSLRQKEFDLGRKIYVNIKLLSRIPGVLDVKQCLWNCLHEKYILLSSEHFIKTSKLSKDIFLKQKNDELEQILVKCTERQFGTLFNILRKPRMNDIKDWIFYVKLPSDYKDKFKCENYGSNLDNIKNQFLKSLLANEQFLKSQSALHLNIGNEYAEIEIINDGFSKPILKVSSKNYKIALDIRNLMSNLLYNNFVASQQEMTVNWSLYSVIETVQRAIKDFVEKRDEGSEDIYDLSQTFHRNIVANLPI